MGWPQPQPEAVQAALDWLRAQDPRLSLDALAGQLRAAGYGNLEVDAAIRTRQAELDAALPPGTDLRSRAATVLMVAFLGTWLVITIASFVNHAGNDLIGISAGIFAMLLLIILAPTLAVVRSSGRLRHGSYGMLAAILAIPFVLLVIVAGTCVALTNPFLVEPV